MDKKFVEQYKEKHASSTIKQRAKSINLSQLDKKSNYHYQFYYQGSEIEPYRIQVFQNIKTVVSTCSCPYDFGGLCKHQVAALDYILKEGSAKSQKTSKTKTSIEIKLEENHQIPLEAIHLLNAQAKQPKSSYGYTETIRKNKMEIQKYAKASIKTAYLDWPAAKQNFIYDAKKNLLSASCSCKTKEDQICAHLGAGLEKIVKTYGDSVFDPRYLEDSIEEYLEEYGMSVEEDYQQFFSFSVDERGFHVKEKIKNIVPSLAYAQKKFLPVINQEAKDSFFVNHSSEKPNQTHGIGFCLEYSDSGKTDFPHFYPFVAKFKKNTKEFASSFQLIDKENLFEKLKGFSKKDRKFVLTVLEFQQSNETFFRNFNLKYFKESSQLFLKVIKASKNYQLFQSDPYKNLVKKNLTPLQLSETKAELIYRLVEKTKFYNLKPYLKIGDEYVDPTSQNYKITPYYIENKQQLYPYKNREAFLYLDRFVKQGELNFQKKHKAQLYEEILAPLAEKFEVETNIFKESKPKSKLKPKANKEQTENLPQKQLYLSDYEGEVILFKPGIQYEEKLILLHSKERRFNQKTQQFLPRDESVENNFLEELQEMHPSFEQQEPPFFLTPEQLIEDQWLLKASEKMRHQEIEVFGANNLKSFKYSLHKPTLSMSVKSNIDWFDLEIEVKFGKEIVPLKDIRKALLKKSKYVPLKNGNFGILPEKWLQKFGKYFKAGEVKKNQIQLSPYQFNIIDDLHEDLEQTPQFLMDLQQKKIRLQNLKTNAHVKVPKNVKATLRPYQLEGLNWLVFLDENKLGGCLADDMGLGKTLQTIAFLSHLKNHNKEKATHLVIAPTSLVFNWEKEIDKFCPSLQTLIYTGIKRHEFFDDFVKYDVVLSTYGSLLNDIEKLKEFSFGYVILDESQTIKNPNSKRYKAARLLKSENRLALTGTPIENNTFDLFAQMNFLNPGLLGSMTHFRKEFSEAIDKQNNEEASDLLSRIIYPFLLRRTKEQVATELPEKTETILYCDMKTEQRKVYESFKEKFRDYLMQKIDENGLAKSQFYVLEGLTKLRQICNSPELLNDEEDYGSASIKLDILTEHIKNKTANHKIVVFSQFTSMLALVKERLEKENIPYTYLDGKTKKREEVVTNFQENDNLRVFLISLKAGGVGLNLTAADYVFLIDPWWNPAVESQAIDRCYRIGQDKHVMAYRMICKDTIEEKIVSMQSNKKKVSASIIQTDASKKSFDNSQIKDLFG